MSNLEAHGEGISMQLGLVGLGRMGANMARRLIRGGHNVVAFDRDAEAVARLGAEGAVVAHSLAELVAKLAPPRAVWVMVPAGAPTEATVRELAGRLSRGDAIIDGGNSHYKDDVRRARELASSGIDYLDVGTSGGVWGLERGYCLMVGGSERAFERLQAVFTTLAPGRGEIPATAGREGRRSTAELGYLYCGQAGAGHFVKMVHNGIEYGLMQAFAEGFDIMRHTERLPEGERYDLELADIAELWRRGSVVSSWLLDLAAGALAADPGLEAYSGFVEDSGEGRWTIAAAIEEAVPAEVLSASLYARFRSRVEHTFGEKLMSAMRKQFGGHVEPKRKGEMTGKGEGEMKGRGGGEMKGRGEGEMKGRGEGETKGQGE
jgi:6-phosphogluconate dehydrogenase